VHEQLRRRESNWLGHTSRQHHQAGTAMDMSRPQMKRATQEHLEKDLEK